MRRYLVRSIVAVLTFSIGVAISLSLGLFKPNSSSNRRYAYRAPSKCRKPSVRTPTMSIDSQPNAPLGLTYLSTSPDSPGRFDSRKVQVRFLVANQGLQDVVGFSISCRKSGVLGESSQAIAWESSSPLRAGEAQAVTFNCDAEDALSLRVETARFSDGARWDSVSDFK